MLRGLARIEQSILDTNSCYNFCFMHGLHSHRQDLISTSIISEYIYIPCISMSFLTRLLCVYQNVIAVIRKTDKHGDTLLLNITHTITYFTVNIKTVDITNTITTTNNTNKHSPAAHQGEGEPRPQQWWRGASDGW